MNSITTAFSLVLTKSLPSSESEQPSASDTRHTPHRVRQSRQRHQSIKTASAFT